MFALLTGTCSFLIVTHQNPFKISHQEGKQRLLFISNLLHFLHEYYPISELFSNSDIGQVIRRSSVWTIQILVFRN